MSEQEAQNKPKDIPAIAILFSGGRDSSLCVCLLASAGYRVHLLSFDDGIGIGSELSNYRYEELRGRFPDRINPRVRIPIFGLFRKIAIQTIEDDFARYEKNLILLGSKLAMHAAATVYCLQHGISQLADGSNRYQSMYAEQTPEAITELKAFAAKYRIEFLNPIWNYESELAVKYDLMEYGISTKSLEGVTIFGDSFSEPSPDLVRTYIRDKLPICVSHIDRMLGRIGTLEERSS